jgi:hypothetical protein
MEHARADQPPVVIDALDDVSVQLALADDGGRKVNPGVQLGTGDRLVAGPAQALQQQLCWASASARCAIVATGVAALPRHAQAQVARIAWRSPGVGAVRLSVAAGANL